jgi:N-methylhydantoinase A
MGYKIGVDVGGTFTDLAVADEDAGLFIAKTLTTPGDEATGILNGLGKVATHYALDLGELLRRTNVIVHGTTVATNAMLQYKGAVTGLLTTQGFRDEIEIRRGIKESAFDAKLEAPFPIAPRRRRLGVPERVDHRGQVLTPLDEGAARAAICRLKDQGVEAIAVCFLFSFLNPGHEQRVRELIAEEYPGVYVSLSSDVLPQVRDFERVSTTLVNAFVGPTLRSYLEALQGRLRERGYRGELFVMQSNGGIMTIEYSAEKSVYSLFSGPAGGIAAATYMGALAGYKDLITVDMGGTSYDVCLIRDGRPAITSDAWFSRYRVAIPLLDIHSIGAGGGSIAWVDPGGALKVGPQSAGSRPGPACYGRGGTQPTVTDADLVLGYLDPDYFAGGELKLDRAAAERAIDDAVGVPLGMSTVDAAWAVSRIVNANMANGIRVVSIQRGYDPRDFALMAFGGAGAVHAGVQAQDLAMPTIIVPKAAPVFCAFGDLIADLRVTEVRTFFAEALTVDLAKMNDLFAHMIADGEARLPASGPGGPGASGAGGDRISVELERYADMRYVGEVHEVTVPIRGRTRRITEQNLRATVKDFHDLHEQLYAHRDPHNPVELLNLRVDVIGRVPRPRAVEATFVGEDSSGAIRARRPVFFGSERGFVDVPVYDGDKLMNGNVMVGPCIIEEPGTTIVVWPGQEALLDRYQNYIIEVGEA